MYQCVTISIQASGLTCNDDGNDQCIFHLKIDKDFI